jgi:hypothetical protein
LGDQSHNLQADLSLLLVTTTSQDRLSARLPHGASRCPQAQGLKNDKVGQEWS